MKSKQTNKENHLLYLPYYCYFVLATLTVGISHICLDVPYLLASMAFPLYFVVLYMFVKLTKWKEKFQEPENDSTRDNTVTDK